MFCEFREFRYTSFLIFFLRFANGGCCKISLGIKDSIFFLLGKGFLFVSIKKTRPLA